MNYTELQTLLQDYLANTETTFVADMAFIVRQAEERIYRDVLIPALRKSDTLTTTISNRLLTKPTDYLAPFHLAVTNGSGVTSILKPKQDDFLVEAYPNSTDTGLPLFYADHDVTNFSLGPVPDAAYSISISYMYDPPSITTATTSWLGDNAETVLLYGCLIEGYTFLKGSEDLMALYQRRYEEALQELATIGEFRLKRDSYRNTEPRK